METDQARSETYPARGASKDELAAETGRAKQSSVTLLAIVVLLLLAAVYSIVAVRGAEQWVRHTEAVRLDLALLQALLVDAETAQRGYLVTGDPVLLEPYTRSLAEWRGRFDRVQKLTVDNDSQQQKLGELERLIGEKFSQMRSARGARDSGATGAQLTPLVLSGKHTMDAIRAVIADMQREEERLQEQRMIEVAKRERIVFLSLLAAVLALMLVGASVWRTRSRQQAADRIRVAELGRALEETMRYRLLVESANDATFILDPEGHVTTWNAAAERIKGYSAAEIVGKHFSEFYSPEDVLAGKPSRELETASRDGLLVDEGWRRRKDGSRFWAHVAITPMRNESGSLVGFAKVTRDLTERAANEERLRLLAAEKAALEATTSLEREQLARRDFLAKAGQALASSLDYRTTLATVARLVVPELADWCSVELLEPGTSALSQVAVVHMDPMKVQVVRELSERYRPDPTATRGAAWVVRTGKSELYSELPTAFLEDAAQNSEHLRLIRELRLESAMVVPLIGRERILGAISFVYAASGRRYDANDLAFAEDFARRAAMAIENAEAHAALGAALEFQERFAAIVGHDLRNPLSAIDMARGLLAQHATMANDATATRILARVESSSRRMSRMIEQILDLSRSRIGGGLEVRPAPMDLRDMLAEVVNELRTAHPSHTIHLRCSSLPGAWDRDRLEQVFSNLVGNAIHHGDGEKPISIDARQEGGAVRVDVHNDGPAIPEELRSELFRPFRRGSKDSRTSKTEGLGLGL